jgi:hypothetical protein
MDLFALRVHATLRGYGALSRRRAALPVLAVILRHPLAHRRHKLVELDHPVAVRVHQVQSASVGVSERVALRSREERYICWSSDSLGSAFRIARSTGELSAEEYNQESEFVSHNLSSHERDLLALK